MTALGAVRHSANITRVRDKAKIWLKRIEAYRTVKLTILGVPDKKFLYQ
jgi:hypothetical protein